MIRFLPILVIVFKVWLMIDAGRRRAPSHWYYIIFFIPFGGVVYFFTYKIHDYNLGNLSKIFSRPPSLDEIRYRAETSPSLENNIYLGQALHDNDLYSEAAFQFEKILKQYPNNSEALHGISASHMALMAYDKAIPFLEKLVSDDPAYLDYRAWPMLAQAHWENNQKEQSLEWLRRLVKLNPRPDHQLILVRCLVELHQSQEARIIIDKSLRDYEHSPKYAKRSYQSVASEMRQLLKKL